VDRLADGADRLREALDRVLRRHVAGLEMHLGGAVIVAGNEAEQNLREEAPLLWPQTSHDAEVDGDQLAGIVDEQIAGMHVGVEEAVAQRVAQEGLDHRAGEALQIEPLGFEPGTVGERRRLDPFEREHVSRRAVPVHRGHAKIGIVPRVLRHLRECGRLKPQIHLDGDRAPERFDHFDQPQAARLRGQPLGVARDEGERVEIDLEAPLDTRPQHLDRDRVAAAASDDFGPVHLRDGGSSDRRTERREQLAQRLAQGGLDLAFGLRLGKRRHLVLQRLEVTRQRRANHVGSRCQELAELHVARTEAGERGGEAVRGHAARRPLDQPRCTHCRARRQRQPRRVDQGEYALACEYEAGTAEARQVGGGCDHNRQPECSATIPPLMRWNETRAKPAVRIISAKACGAGKRRIDSTR
jgi:hypothetical protein